MKQSFEKTVFAFIVILVGIVILGLLTYNDARKDIDYLEELSGIYQSELGHRQSSPVVIKSVASLKAASVNSNRRFYLTSYFLIGLVLVFLIFSFFIIRLMKRTLEKRYYLALDNMLEGVQVIGTDWRYLYINETAARQTKFQACELLGRTMMEIHAGFEKTDLFKTLDQCMRDGCYRQMETDFAFPDNTVEYYQLSIQSVPEGIFILSMDITERKNEEKQKEKRTQDLEKARIAEQLAVTDAVITGEEKARQEMGRELHDNINQILATAQLYLGMFLQTNSGPDNFIQKTDGLITSAIKEIRDLAHSTISPFIEDGSLPVALETLSTITERSGAIKITRKFTNLEETPMPEKLKLTLYRIVQEQFQNILKYAKAKNIFLELHCEECIASLLIRDDGVGFDPSQKASGIGMKNMKTRISLFQGENKVISSPGHGCSLIVKCHYPCI